MSNASQPNRMRNPLRVALEDGRQIPCLDHPCSTVVINAFQWNGVFAQGAFSPLSDSFSTSGCLIFLLRRGTLLRIVFQVPAAGLRVEEGFHDEVVVASGDHAEVDPRKTTVGKFHEVVALLL